MEIPKEKSASRAAECRHMWYEDVCLKCGKKMGETMNIELDCGNYILGEYIISGNDKDGFIVYHESNYDSDIVEVFYRNKSLDKCLCWCLNS